MDIKPILGIAIVLFALAEILKRTVFKNDDEKKAIIPYFCAILGAVAASVLFLVDPAIIGTETIMDAIVAGGVSGLIATGAHQIYKQFYKMILVANSVKEETENEVADMTADEKKEYLTNQATDIGMKILDSLNESEKDSQSDSKE